MRVRACVRACVCACICLFACVCEKDSEAPPLVIFRNTLALVLALNFYLRLQQSSENVRLRFSISVFSLHDTHARKKTEMTR